MTTDPGMTIADVAARTGLTAHTLRYYERDGLMLGDIGRASSGHRRYTRFDVAWIELVTRLRATGMPIGRSSGMRSWSAPATALSRIGWSCWGRIASGCLRNWRK